MRDGYTRKIQSKEAEDLLGSYHEHHRVTLVVVKGPAAGTEYILGDSKVVVGRGPGVDLAFSDEAMSREHVAFELVEGGYRVRDLASTNGLRVNGSDVLTANLKHGDTVELGDHRFQFLVEKRSGSGKAHVIPDL